MTTNRPVRRKTSERNDESHRWGKRAFSYWKGLQPQIIRFMGALVVAVGAWLVFKLSDTYSMVLSMNVRYVNPPKKYKVSSKLPAKWNILVRGRGRDLFFPYFRLGLDTIKINLSKKGDLPIDSILAVNEKRKIKRRLPASVKVVSVAPSKLKVHFSPKIYKMVPVKSNLEIIPKNGFYLTEPVSFTPDSVLIAGTVEQLSDYQSWLTTRQTITDLNRASEKTVKLLQVNDIEVSPAKVTAHFKVVRFTEGEIEKEIVVDNLPVNERIEFFPSKVKVKYLVPMDSYKRITEKDFRIVIDYDDINFSSKYLVPELKGTPNLLKGVRTDPPYVQYVVTTQK